MHKLSTISFVFDTVKPEKNLWRFITICQACLYGLCIHFPHHLMFDLKYWLMTVLYRTTDVNFSLCLPFKIYTIYFIIKFFIHYLKSIKKFIPCSEYMRSRLLCWTGWTVILNKIRYSFYFSPNSTSGDHLLKLKLIMIKIYLLKLKIFPFLCIYSMWTDGWIGWGVAWWSRHLVMGVQIPGGASLVALTPTDGATEWLVIRWLRKWLKSKRLYDVFPCLPIHLRIVWCVSRFKDDWVST
jgi:hypothetical protein